jgi:hypothetical protein
MDYLLKSVSFAKSDLPYPLHARRHFETCPQANTCAFSPCSLAAHACFIHIRTDNVHPLGARLLQGTDARCGNSQPLAATALASSVTGAGIVVSKTTCWQPRRRQPRRQQPATWPPASSPAVGRATASTAEGLLGIFLVWPFTPVDAPAELNVTQQTFHTHTTQETSHVLTLQCAHTNKHHKQTTKSTHVNWKHTSLKHIHTSSHVLADVSCPASFFMFFGSYSGSSTNMATASLLLRATS